MLVSAPAVPEVKSGVAYNMSYIWSISLVAALGGLLFGYDWVVIGGAKPFFEKYFNLGSEALVGWANSCALVGCLLGSLITGGLSDHFGRKKLLLSSAVLFAASSIATGWAYSFNAFVIWRIAGGVAIGMASNLSPVYIAEVAPAHIRGKLVSINQLTIVLGIVAAQVVNLAIAEKIPDGQPLLAESWNCQFGWRWMFSAVALPSLLFVEGTLWIPESPRWMISRGMAGRARRVAQIGGAIYAENEIRDVQSTRSSQSESQARFRDLLAPGIRKILLVGVTLAVLQQWSGINIIFNYAEELYTAAGYGVNDVLFNIVITGAINLLVTAIAIFTVDRLGRRPLMLIGCASIAVSHVLLGAAYLAGMRGLPVLVLTLCAIGSYGLSLAPITWVLISEIFPNRIRGVGTSAAVSALWIACFILTYSFPVLKRAAGMAGTFWMYAAICAAGFVFVLLRVTETKGKTLEQIERELGWKRGGAMHIRMIHALRVGVFFMYLAGLAAATELSSPDGKLELTFQLKKIEGASACPVYDVAYKGKKVIDESRLGLELREGPLTAGLKIISETNTSHDSTWKPVYGERSVVRDHYNALKIEMQEEAAPRRIIHLTFRAYDAGVAFCYTLPVQPGIETAAILREKTEFRFSEDFTAWTTVHAQGSYSKTTLSKVPNGCERPLPIQAADDLYLALGEARLVDYARMKFAQLKDQPHALAGVLSGPVTAALPLTTPWRFIMTAESPGKLLEHNDLLLNLNDPCEIADTSWIKPGKVLREVSLTTLGARACVNFAAQHHLQYVLFDAGWYGNEDSPKSDASAVNLDPKRSAGPLDLQDVIAYGKEHGIGIILYVNHIALEKQLDQILPLYKKWGVKGVKFGFVNVGSQRWTAWLHEAVRKAAENQLMIDVHDDYRMTGYERTYPNFMTAEGIAGDETLPGNAQTLTTLFSRYLGGPADNTVCYFDPRFDKISTHAYRLAKAVCLYSPLQHLYWYDRPATIPGGNSVLGNEPELEFWDHMPAAWDETKVLHGRIGEYAVIARRRGDAWFIGCMNSREPRTLNVALDFLKQGRKYTAFIYSDDPTVSTRTHVKIEQMKVDADTVLKAVMSEKGGQAIRIIPAP